MRTLLLLLAALACNFSTASAQIPIDYDGNPYTPVTIGTQVWLMENLKTTHFMNGVPIPNTIDSLAWATLGTAPGRCYYNNDSASMDSLYGALYNWHVVKDTSKVCPIGYHIPSDGEWTILENFLGGAGVAGGKLKEAGTLHWTSPNTGANNSSGFTGLPGGMRGMNHVFTTLHENGLWWTSTQQSSANAYSRYLWYMNGGVDRNPTPKFLGLSIRCIKDVNPGTSDTHPAPGIRLWPNPAEDVVHFSTAKEGTTKYTIFNASGVEMGSGKSEQTFLTINVRHLPPAVYFIRIQCDAATCYFLKILKL